MKLTNHVSIVPRPSLSHDLRPSALRRGVAPLRPADMARTNSNPWRKIHAIVVPLDGTPFAEHALPYAISLAERSGAVLKLVHVHLPYEEMDAFEVLYSTAEQLHTLKRRKKNYLVDVTKRIATVSAVRVERCLVTSNDITRSLEMMARLESDLVVMAHHARGPISRLWFGSVVHRLLPKLTVPVLLVRGDESLADLRPKTIDHILVPLDGTHASERVLEPAVKLGQIFSAKHTLMQVLPLELKYQVRHGTLSSDLVPSKQGEKLAHAYLENLAFGLRSRFLTVQTRIVSSDEDISEVIVNNSEEGNSNLIAVTLGARGLLSRIVRKSAQHLLIRNAHVPLLIVPRSQDPDP